MHSLRYGTQDTSSRGFPANRRHYLPNWSRNDVIPRKVTFAGLTVERRCPPPLQGLPAGPRGRGCRGDQRWRPCKRASAPPMPFSNCEMVFFVTFGWCGGRYHENHGQRPLPLIMHRETNAFVALWDAGHLQSRLSRESPPLSTKLVAERRHS
jgi:hypothetical protein